MDEKINEFRTEVLPMSALDDIPKAKSDAKEIVALVKSRGRISGYKLSDGTILSREEGVELAKQGGINGVGIAHKKDTVYLKSLPDGTENNNLNSLPSIAESEVQNKTF